MVQDGAARSDRGSYDLRRMMVDNQIRTFDVTDQRVLEVFYLIPRETSLPPALASLAYSDAPIHLPTTQPDHEARVLIPPLFLAKMIQGADIEIGQKVLLVGGGSGYAAALLAELTGSVVALESDAGLNDTAAAYLKGIGLDASVRLVTGPLDEGYAAGGPYDLILVPGGVEDKLDKLMAQLGPKGRLVCIEIKGREAARRSGKAMRYDKIDGRISGRVLFDALAPVMEAFREPAAFVF